MGQGKTNTFFGRSSEGGWLNSKSSRKVKNFLNSAVIVKKLYITTQPKPLVIIMFPQPIVTCLQMQTELLGVKPHLVTQFVGHIVFLAG